MTQRRFHNFLHVLVVLCALQASMALVLAARRLDRGALHVAPTLSEVDRLPFRYPPVGTLTQAAWFLGGCLAAAGLLLPWGLTAAQRRGHRVSLPTVAWVATLTAILILAGLELRLRSYIASCPQPPMVPHPFLLWAPTPHMPARWDTNSLGMRGPDLPLARPPGVVHILVLGASPLWGGLVLPTRETFPAQLADRLNGAAAPGVRYQVVNAAVQAYSSLQCLEMLREVGLQYHPNILVCGFSVDASLAPLPDADRVPTAAWARTVRALLYRSQTFLLLRQLHFRLSLASYLAQARQGLGGIPHPGWSPRVPIPDFRRALTRILGLAARHGVHCVLLQMPHGPSTPRDPMEAYLPVERECATAVGAQVLDIFDEWLPLQRGDWFLSEDGQHLSARGCGRLADEVARCLRRTGWCATRRGALP